MKLRSNLKKVVSVVLLGHFLVLLTAFVFKPKIKLSKNEPIIIRSVIKSTPVKSHVSPGNPSLQQKKEPTKSPKKPLPATHKIKKETKKIAKDTSPATKSISKKVDGLKAEELVVPQLTTQEPPQEEKPSIAKVSLNSIFEILESLIALPKKGMIKAKIIINSNGTIEAIDTLENEHPENERYLIETLKGFKLPNENSLLEKQELVVIFRGV